MRVPWQPHDSVARTRTRNRVDQTPFEVEITGLTHDGRGVARRGDGKAVFVAGALPGERVRVQQSGRQRSFDEARTLEVLQASPDRVEPRCQKRRGKNYPYMIHPRPVLRQRLLDQQPAA